MSFNFSEIVKEVESGGDKLNVTALLRCNADQLEPNCLNRALVAAVKNDDHFNVGKLVVKGANNLEECLQMSKDERKPHARAMLLMVKAAMEGNQALIRKLFGETHPAEDDESAFEDVQKAVVSGNISTVVPIEIARRNGHSGVREELLLKTDVNQEEGSVYWHGLRLLVLDISWLQKIQWVKRLRLARNDFKSLPNEIGSYLQQVQFVYLFPQCMGLFLLSLLLFHNASTFPRAAEARGGYRPSSAREGGLCPPSQQDVRCLYKGSSLIYQPFKTYL